MHPQHPAAPIRPPASDVPQGGHSRRALPHTPRLYPHVSFTENVAFRTPGTTHVTRSVPVSTAGEVTGTPAAAQSGEIDSMAGDGTRKVAFITGTTGQDSSYLVELLLSKGTILFTSLADLAQIAPRSRRERRRPRSTRDIAE